MVKLGWHKTPDGKFIQVLSGFGTGKLYAMLYELPTAESPGRKCYIPDLPPGTEFLSEKVTPREIFNAPTMPFDCTGYGPMTHQPYGAIARPKAAPRDKAAL
jgi:hypothetical protein